MKLTLIAALFVLSMSSMLPGQTMKFTPIVIRDPKCSNIEAMTVLAPDGWQMRGGGLTWNFDFSMKVFFSADLIDPKSGAAITFLPAQQFCAPNPNSGLPQNYWNISNGAMVLPAPRDANEFVQGVYAARADLPLARLRGAQVVAGEDLPAVAREFARSSGADQQGLTVRATRIRYTYAVENQPWEEDVYAILTYGQPNQFMQFWWFNGYSTRAPAGQLDKARPLLLSTVSTMRINPLWTAIVEEVRKVGRQGDIDVNARIAEIHRVYMEDRARFNETWGKISQDRQASADRQNAAFRENLGGIETRRDPYESRNYELPQGYKDYWVNSRGEVILSMDQTYNPNVGNTVEYKKMEQVQPGR